VIDKATAKPGMTIAVYKRPFKAGPVPAQVIMRARMTGLYSELVLGGKVVATDQTPAAGPDAVRNHRLSATLADGRVLDIEAGYVNSWTVGIAVTLDGTPIHESHPGKRIAYPEKHRKVVSEAPGETMGAVFKNSQTDQGVDLGVYKRNKVPIAVDFALMLLFFVVAKMTDLRTAALLGAGVGIALIVAQRFIKTDIIGGMALFGIIMALISAGFAWVFEDDAAIKMRSTIVGLIGAAFFLGDGLLLRGRRLGAGMARYLPYADIEPARLAIGMGAAGLIMAGLNYVVLKLFSTDVWLIYHSFLDTVVFMFMMFGVFKYARTGTPVPAAS